MKKPSLKLFSLKFWIPLAILVGGFFIIAALLSSAPKVQPKPKSAKLPGVEVLTVVSAPISIPVHTRGTVSPATQIQLTSEVNGSVVAISKKFSDGSYFRKGDWLLKVDTAQHEMELEKALAQEASARVNLLRTQANQRSGNVEGIKVGKRSELAKGIPQLREAEANYNAAKSTVRLARKQLEKTTIVAPFDGRVLKKAIDIKEYAAAGKPIAQLYSIDKAEVRLPLTSAQLELVDIPLRYDNETDSKNQPIVILEDSDKKYKWKGRIVRSEGNIDPRNRLTYVIAEIDKPYARDPKQPKRPPLSSGSFVSATIQGRLHDSLFSVPLNALHNMDEIHVLDSDNRLHMRQVSILYRGKDRAYINGGLEDGEKIILTPMEIAVENMEVVVLKELDPLPPIISSADFSLAENNEPAEQENSSPEPKKKTKNNNEEIPIDPKDMAGMMGNEQETDI